MSKPIVIRQLKGAIATIVLYLRRGNKISPELRSKAIQMAEKEEPKDEKVKNRGNQPVNKVNDQE